MITWALWVRKSKSFLRRILCKIKLVTQFHVVICVRIIAICFWLKPEKLLEIQPESILVRKKVRCIALDATLNKSIFLFCKFLLRKFNMIKFRCEATSAGGGGKVKTRKKLEIASQLYLKSLTQTLPITISLVLMTSLVWWRHNSWFKLFENIFFCLSFEEFWS